MSSRSRSASIQLKRGVYYVVYRDPVDRRQRWKRAGTTKREAKLLLNEIEGQLLRNEYQETKSATFAQFVTIWLDRYPKLRNMKPSTVRDYTSAFRAHWTPEFGDMKLENINLEMLQRYVAERLDEGMSARRMADVIVPLKTMFKWAVKWNYLRFSPATDLQKPKYDTPEMDWFTPEEAHRLIAEIDDYWRPLLMVMFMTGVRPGEAIALRWKDLDLQHNLLNVRFTLDRGQLLPPKTDNARRRIPMPPELVSALQSHRNVSPPNPAGLAFVMPESGAPIDLSNLRNRVFHPALERAQLRRIRLYDIRHSYAAWMISLNVEPLQLSKNMGHYDLGFTYRTYGHLMPVSGHDEATRLGALFTDASPQDDACTESRPEWPSSTPTLRLVCVTSERRVS